jgi:DNA-binding winged helix-turn-helix (wHTH) protein/tetratricopeptide (TPR) repeat protein
MALMAATDRQIFAMGEFTLDVSQGRLLSAQGDVALRPKAMRLLSVLAKSGGRVVSKDELMSEVWPDVFVTDDSLTQCVHELRAALGVESAALLKTVPRRGYMLSGLNTVTLAEPDLSANVAPGTIAVMPFALPEGLDPQTCILFDGLTHDVISRLARLRAYRVTGRGSVFALRSLSGDVLRLRQLLRVAYVATGRVSVQPGGGDGFRLVVDLVRTADGSLEWVEDIAVSINTLNLASAVIADRLVSAIALAVTEAERRQALSEPGTPLDAWSAFHRGVDRAFRFTAGDMLAALEHFRVATELEPGFARAHAYASFCTFYFAFSGQNDDRAEATTTTLRWAGSALEADPLSPVAHWAYGRALWLAGDPDTARDHVARAIALCPSFPNAHYMLGFIECYNGDPEAALKHMEISEEQSPFDPFLASIQLTRATAHMRLGDLDRAAYWAGRSTAHRTAYGQMLYHAALVQVASGRKEEACKTLGTLAQRHPDYDGSRYLANFCGMTEDVSALLRRSQMQLAN